MADHTFSGRILVTPASSSSRAGIVLAGDQAHLFLGIGGKTGELWVRNGGLQGGATVTPQEISIVGSSEARGWRKRIHLDGSSGLLSLGDAGVDGFIRLVRAGGAPALEVSSSDSLLTMLRQDGQPTLSLDSERAHLWLGGNGARGDIALFDPATPHSRTFADAKIRLSAEPGDVIASGTVTAQDVILPNADAAEDFDVEGAVEPGSVMSIRDARTLGVSKRAYDRCVAGVVSGAGGLRPGIVLGRTHKEDARVPIALAGRVSVKASDESGPISVGDLLTTSWCPGHAMRAEDNDSAFGAVIGKALEPLPSGYGLIQMLVALH